MHQLSFADAAFSGLPPGLELHDEIVSPVEEKALVALIDQQPLSPFRFQGWLGKRLTRSYGWSYDFEAGRFEECEPMPTWLQPLRQRAADLVGSDAATFVQALLIRYDPGAGIGWHRDRPVFGDVMGISLGAAAQLRLRRRTATGFERRTVQLAPRSLYRLTGSARHDWQHSIVPIAETRWSVTFRSLSDT